MILTLVIIIVVVIAIVWYLSSRQRKGPQEKIEVPEVPEKVTEEAKPTAPVPPATFGPIIPPPSPLPPTSPPPLPTEIPSPTPPVEPSALPSENQEKPSETPEKYF